MASRTITIKGKRYTVSTRSYDCHLDIRGHGVNRCIDGTTLTLDSPDFRERITEAIRMARENHADAAKHLQASLAKERGESNEG